MAKLKMKRFVIACMQSDGKKLVEQLQRLGAAELDKMCDERFEDMQVSDIVSVCEKKLVKDL